MSSEQGRGQRAQGAVAGRLASPQARPRRQAGGEGSRSGRHEPTQGPSTGATGPPSHPVTGRRRKGAPAEPPGTGQNCALRTAVTHCGLPDGDAQAECRGDTGRSHVSLGCAAAPRGLGQPRTRGGRCTRRGQAACGHTDCGETKSRLPQPTLGLQRCAVPDTDTPAAHTSMVGSDLSRPSGRQSENLEWAEKDDLVPYLATYEAYLSPNL